MPNRKLSKVEILKRYFTNTVLAHNYFERWKLTESEQMWEMFTHHRDLAENDKSFLNRNTEAA